MEPLYGVFVRQAAGRPDGRTIEAMKPLVYLALAIGIGPVWLAAQAPASDPPPPPPCTERAHCLGPKIGGLKYSLLVGPVSSVAAAPEIWGDYVKVHLILTNHLDPVRESSAMRFRPAEVVATRSDGASVKVATDVIQLEAERSHTGFLFGSGMPGGMLGTLPGAGSGPYPPVNSTIGRVLANDPVAHAQAMEEERRNLGKHQNELKQALAEQLGDTMVKGGETRAGYVLLPLPPAGQSLTVVSVTLGEYRFDLPLR